MPRTDWGWQTTPDEIRSWIIQNDDSLLVVNKPAHLVCHPSKKGAWSSLIGACREFLQAERLHLTSRLDRETSGVVVIAKQATVARELNIALQDRAVEKTYLAILEGLLPIAVTVDEPIGPDTASSFVARQSVVAGGQPSTTEFIPVAYTDQYTFARVRPMTGRRHQIRVHAAHIGHAIVGDKLYGPDETIMHRFITQGCTPDMMQQLKLDRQALHAYQMRFPDHLVEQPLTAALAPELAAFWLEQGGRLPPDLQVSRTS